MWEPLRVMASARGTQNEFLRKAQKFFNATSSLAKVPKIMVLTDGCNMGRKFCASHPAGQAVWQLDWWHLFNSIQHDANLIKTWRKKYVNW